MQEYSFYYSEILTNKAWIQAESIEDARIMLEQIQDGKLEIVKATDDSSVPKNYELEIDLDSLRTVEVPR